MRIDPFHNIGKHGMPTKWLTRAARAAYFILTATVRPSPVGRSVVLKRPFWAAVSLKF